MMNLPEGISMQDFLFNINVHELLNKIDRFRQLNLRKLSRKEIQKEIMEVLLFDNKSVLLQYGHTIKKGTEIYRIRKLENGDIPNRELKRTQDFWNPPSEKVKRMRLNKPHESLLYGCFDVGTAIEETKTSSTDSFALIIYDVKDNIKAVRIAPDDNFSEYNNDEKLKLRILNSFLKEEFSRDVGDGNEHLYKVSEIIAKDYFDLPLQDAWIYPSIANKPAINICFRPEIAKEKLDVKQVLIAHGYSIKDNNMNLNIKGSIRIINDNLIYV